MPNAAPRGPLVTGILVALLLAAGGRALRSHWAPDLYYQRFDYGPLALGQALNLEMASRGALPRPVLYYQLYHPGLPFQVVSWLALRLGSEGAADPIESAMKVLRDPSGYWRASGIAGALLTLTGLALLIVTARGLPAMAVAAVLASYFCLDSSWVSGFMFLTNDSFALPLAALLLLVARRVFASEQPLWGPLVAAGCVAGLAYLCKLPYLIWTLSFGAGLLVRSLMAPTGSRLRWLAGGLAFGAGWLATFGTLTGLMMTRQSVVEMLRLHLGTASHSGYHGGGEGGPVDVHTILFGLVRLFDHPLFLTMLALLAVSVASVVRTRPEQERRGAWPFATMVAVTVALALAAVLKHYKVYYLLVGLAFVPPALAWCFQALPAAWRPRLAVAVLALCGASFASQWVRPPMDLPHWSRYVPWRGAAAEIAAIEALPLAPGEVRAWRYGCFGPGYYRQFAAGISGYQALLDRVWAAFPQDRTTADSSLDWRYAIFEWNLIDPGMDDPASAGLFAGMRAEAQAFLAQGEPVAGFKRYLVIERRRAQPASAAPAAAEAGFRKER